jgi:hypothetical protein
MSDQGEMRPGARHRPGECPWCYVCDELHASLRDVTDVFRERIMRFGGMQRTPQGEFWISRDDVLRLLDEYAFRTPDRTAPADDQPETAE